MGFCSGVHVLSTSLSRGIIASSMRSVDIWSEPASENQTVKAGLLYGVIALNPTIQFQILVESTEALVRTNEKGWSVDVSFQVPNTCQDDYGPFLHHRVSFALYELAKIAQLGELWSEYWLTISCKIIPQDSYLL